MLGKFRGLHYIEEVPRCSYMSNNRIYKAVPLEQYLWLYLKNKWSKGLIWQNMIVVLKVGRCFHTSRFLHDKLYIIFNLLPTS